MWHGLNLTVEWDIKFNAFRLHHDKTAAISLLFLSTLCHSWCGHDNSWRTHQEITARARLQKTCSEHFTSIGFIMLPLSWCYLYCLLLLLWLGHRFMYVMYSSVLISKFSPRLSLVCESAFGTVDPIWMYLVCFMFIYSTYFHYFLILPRFLMICLKISLEYTDFHILSILKSIKQSSA